MTGGQAIEGQLSVPDLTRWLELEGVRRIIVTAEDTSRYRGVELAAIAELRDRTELLAAQQELAEVEGVTVLIHDQECAAELRRLRKRGKAARAERADLDQRARMRGLRRLRPEVELPVGDPGRDRVRPQDADPPGLVQQGLLVPRGRLPLVPHRGAGRAAPSAGRPRSTPSCPSPSGSSSDDDFAVRMMGIGGTGVVTVNQVLGHGRADRRPARLRARPDRPLAEGRPGRSPTCASRASRSPARARRRPGAIDLYLGFDLLGAAEREEPRHRRRPSGRWRSCRHTRCPTGRMVVDVNERFPELAAQLDRIDATTRAEHNLYLDAQALSERLFGDHMMTNTLALGAAYQRGMLPVSAEALEQAIRLNGAAVEKNLAAFAWGRAVVAAPGRRRAGHAPPGGGRAGARAERGRARAGGPRRGRRSGRAAPPRRGARARAGRLPGRGLRAPLGRARAAGARRRAGAHARATPSWRRRWRASSSS